MSSLLSNSLGLSPSFLPCEYEPFGCAAVLTRDMVDQHLKQDAHIHVSLLKTKFAVEKAQKEHHLEALHHAQTRCREKDKENATLRREIEALQEELLALPGSSVRQVSQKPKGKASDPDIEEVRRLVGSLLPPVTVETMVLAKQSQEIERLRNEIIQITASLSSKKIVAQTLRAQAASEQKLSGKKKLEDIISESFESSPAHYPRFPLTFRRGLGHYGIPPLEDEDEDESKERDIGESQADTKESAGDGCVDLGTELQKISEGTENHCQTLRNLKLALQGASMDLFSEAEKEYKQAIEKARVDHDRWADRLAELQRSSLNPQKTDSMVVTSGIEPRFEER